MQLRPYQARAVAAVRAALPDHRSVLLVSPTGSGKTTMGAALAQAAALDGETPLWVAHRTELIDQAAAALGAAVGPGVARVASIQTLHARGERPPADLLILDEAHHCAAETFRGLTAAYPNARILGLTATPARGDGRALDTFEHMIVAARPRELETAGYLVPMEIVRPAKPLKPGQIAQRPVDAWRQHAMGRSTIVFCASVEHAEREAASFSAEAHAFGAAVIEASTPPKERRDLLDDYRIDYAPRVLCNVAVLTEGTDLPNTSCIILTRGCGHAGLYMQMTGRGSRPHPGKTDCIIIDLRGVSHVHGHPYDDREYSLEGIGIRRPSAPANQSYCRVCGAPIEAGAGCDECGIEAASAKPITVTNTPLVKYAAARRQGADRRAANLRRWKLEAATAGHRIGRAYVRYQAVYGERVPPDVERLSRE